ncbi:MAG: hypothetical protein ACJA1E_001182 [Paracoccaceae bacterium]|jgi:hypothetical protein
MSQAKPGGQPALQGRSALNVFATKKAHQFVEKFSNAVRVLFTENTNWADCSTSQNRYFKRLAREKPT